MQRVYATGSSEMYIVLPALTKLVLSSWFAAFIVILLAGSVVKEIVVKNKLHILIANGVVLILLGLLKALVNMALFSPILKLMDGLYEKIAT